MTFSGKIIAHKRLNNSINGNPRYRLVISLDATEETVVVETSRDASCNYEVTNYSGKPVTLCFHTTRAGRVCNFFREDSQYDRTTF